MRLGARKRNGSAERAGQLPHDPQPEAGAGAAGRIAADAELAEDALLIRLGDASAVVADAHLQPFAVAGVERQRRLAAAGVLEGVRQQVADHLFQRQRVGDGNAMGRALEPQLDPVVLGFRAHGIDQLPQRGAEVDAAGMQRVGLAVQAAQVEQHTQPFGVAGQQRLGLGQARDDLGLLPGLRGQASGGHLQRQYVQRVAQFVRRDGQQFVALADAVAQAFHLRQSFLQR
jgi:hypothetical protein